VGGWACDFSLDWPQEYLDIPTAESGKAHVQPPATDRVGTNIFEVQTGYCNHTLSTQ
jgi:hypothetical protein